MTLYKKGGCVSGGGFFHSSPRDKDKISYLSYRLDSPGRGGGGGGRTMVGQKRVDFSVRKKAIVGTMVHSSAKAAASIRDKWELHPSPKRHCLRTRRTRPYPQTDEIIQHSRSPLTSGGLARSPNRPTQKSRPSSSRHPLAHRLVMMWHTHEHRVLAPEESPTMEHADDFLDAHADVVLYSGQDTACASKPSFGQYGPGTTCTPCAELPPVVDGASICAEEQAPRVGFEPCLTRITVKVCYGGEELILTTDEMCYSLLR